ncbi:MAG TPA: hypothetical protein P5228_09635 [Bacteroidales bacterium]|nr:hypothetical protein [Bacteroidales bacterium]
MSLPHHKIGLITGLTALMFFSSCAVRNATSIDKENSTLTPNRVEVHLTPDNLVYLGEVSFDVDYRIYLGFIRHIDSINSIPYNRRESIRVALSGPTGLNLPPVLEQASYKLYEKYPDADYYIINRNTRFTRHMFMGMFIHQEATVKAFKIKYSH